MATKIDFPAPATPIAEGRSEPMAREWRQYFYMWLKKKSDELTSLFIPSGTGFRHVTNGVEDATAKLVQNADVHVTAGIAESKLALAYGTSALNSAIAGKVTANGAITGATKTKITYDAKGLVTAGADATAADVGAVASNTAITPGTGTKLTVDAKGLVTVIASATATDVGLGNVTNDSQVKRSEMGTNSGVATLDIEGKLNTAQLPDLAVVQYLGSAASQVAMLALTGQQGDWCIRADLGTTWVITGADPTQIGSWTQLSYPTAPVTSVNTKTGAVTLGYGDVGAEASGAVSTHAALTTGVHGLGGASQLNVGVTTGTVAAGDDSRFHSNANDPTAGEKAALAGTYGTPGDGNRYVTATDATHVLTDGTRPFTAHIELTETTVPASPANTAVRVYAEDFHGFSLLSYVDSTGMVRRLARDATLVGRNTTGSTIAAGSPVYARTSPTGSVPSLGLAKADSMTTMPSIGVTIESIANNAFGRYMPVGALENVDTSAFAEGDLLYVSATTAGTLTATPPLYPNLRQDVGTVLVSGVGNGSIQLIARSVFNESIISYTGLLNLPTLAATKTAVSHQWLSAYDAGTGAFSQSQPAWADIDKTTSSVLDIAATAAGDKGKYLRSNPSTGAIEWSPTVLPQSYPVSYGTWLDSYDAATGLFTSTTPTAAQVGAAAGDHRHNLTTLGDMPVGGTAGGIQRLAGKTTTGQWFLGQTVTAGVPAQADWFQLALTDIPGKAVASGLATLDPNSKVVQNPASASTTGGANAIVQLDANGRLALSTYHNAPFSFGATGGVKTILYDNNAANTLAGSGIDMSPGSAYEHSQFCAVSGSGVGHFSWGSWDRSTYTERMRLTEGGLLSVNGLTASRALATGANKELVSLAVPTEITKGSDTTLVNASTWYDHVSTSLGAGTWRVTLNATMNNSGASYSANQLRVYDSTHTATLGRTVVASLVNGAYLPIPLSTIFTLTSTSTIVMQAYASLGNQVIIDSGSSMLVEQII